MAILDRPLYADTAKGKIKSLLTFFDRAGRASLRIIGRSPTTSTPSREVQKAKFSQALNEWYELTSEEKQAYQDQAIDLETAFNAYLKQRIPQR